MMTKKVEWTPGGLASPSADPELNQTSWDEFPDELKAHTSRADWKRNGPGGYERWRRFVWLDGDIEILPPRKR